jgi:hypothetical protein
MVELGEFQLRGYAGVIDIRGPPAIEAGPGRVVLTTISRTNTEVLDLRIAGLVEPLEITSKHRLYSSDRADWVHAEELLEGELLETDGGTAQVLSVEPKAGAHRVYNIEVETDHEYLVSDLAVRSHNANKGKGGKGGCGPGGTGGVGPVNAGKKGDALGKARETRNGATLLGEQISIARVGDPKMRIFARIDLLTFLKKRLRFNENKFGDSARLSAGQIELDEILSSGGSVLLVGKNARDQVPKRFLGVPVGGDFFENRFGQTKKSKSKSKSKSKAKSSRRRR